MIQEKVRSGKGADPIKTVVANEIKELAK